MVQQAQEEWSASFLCPDSFAEYLYCTSSSHICQSCSTSVLVPSEGTGDVWAALRDIMLVWRCSSLPLWRGIKTFQASTLLGCRWSKSPGMCQTPCRHIYLSKRPHFAFPQHAESSQYHCSAPLSLQTGHTPSISSNMAGCHRLLERWPPFRSHSIVCCPL